MHSTFVILDYNSNNLFDQHHNIRKHTCENEQTTQYVRMQEAKQIKYIQTYKVKIVWTLLKQTLECGQINVDMQKSYQSNKLQLIVLYPKKLMVHQSKGERELSQLNASVFVQRHHFVMVHENKISDESFPQM